jgi:ATP-dependent RNA helicase DeaD
MDDHEKDKAQQQSTPGDPGTRVTAPPTGGQEPSSAEAPKPESSDVELKDLPVGIREACTRAGWAELMPVQARTIPYFLKGIDLMVQSRTGSGKTGAFMLPIHNRIRPEDKGCQALVLAPTRELALQVARDSATLAGDSGIRTVPVYGGAAYGPQILGFRDGAQVVVGTPGRILDHLIKGTLTLKDLKFLVFDEADRMLSMGFYPDMRRVKTFLPRHTIQGTMFSATFPPPIMRLAREFLREPEFLSLSTDHIHVAETEHIYYMVPGMGKERALVRILEVENPHSAFIFCNTKSQVHFVAEVLKRFGYDADELSADLSQAARERVMGRIRKGDLRFLVATDVAARGIDIPELTHVIQYEPPEDPEAYIHRAGRTGRAGGSGTAITLVAGMDLVGLQKLGNIFKIPFEERHLPTEEELQAVVSQRATALLEARLRGKNSLERERIARFVPLAKSLIQCEDEWDLVAMLIDETYQGTYNIRPEVPEKEQRGRDREMNEDRNRRRNRERPRDRGPRRR